MPSTTDLIAEQEVTRQLHEWNKSAFGGLLDYLRKRCSIEQKYLDDLRSLLRDGEQRTACSLRSVEDVWECDLQLLREEVNIREQRIKTIKTRLEDLQTQEFLRQRSSEALYNSLEESIKRYEQSKKTTWTAFNNSVAVLSTPKLWKRRPTTAEMTEEELDRHDASFRRCLYDLNNTRLKAASRFRNCLAQEQITAAGVKTLYNQIVSLTQDIAHHLNSVGITLINKVDKINTHRDSIPRQEWLENHISDIWISPIAYYNFQCGEPCRYMVFGLPFVSPDEKVPVYESNPRPYDVGRVLVASARSRTNAAPTLQVVRPPREILHKIERGWETTWEVLPNQYLVSDLDLFQLLVHFFSSLPQPFIELDQELKAEIARHFSRWTQDPDLGTLGKVFEKTKSSEEKKLLVRLLKLLERHPAEGSRIFAKPLFRAEGQELGHMLFALIHSWRTFQSQTTPQTIPLPLEVHDSYQDSYGVHDYSYPPSMASPAATTMMGASTWPQSPVHYSNQRRPRNDASDVRLQPTRHLGN